MTAQTRGAACPDGPGAEVETYRRGDNARETRLVETKRRGERRSRERWRRGDVRVELRRRTRVNELLRERRPVR